MAKCNDDASPGRMHMGSFVVRTPLFAATMLCELGAGLSAARAFGEGRGIVEAIEADRANVRRRLDAWLHRPVVREALYFAAPRLLDEVPAWRRDPESKIGRGVERSLVRYFTRASNRCTPFGLFSGVSVGTVGPACQGQLGAEVGRRVVLDTDLLLSLAGELSGDPDVWSRTRLFTNTTLSEIGESFRYVEVRQTGRGRAHDLASTEMTEPLQRIVERARHGALPSELVDVVRDLVPDVEEDEALDYVRELHANDVLRSELLVEVTGRPPTTAMIETLRQAGSPVADTLAGVEDRLRALDATAPGVDVGVYEDVRRELDGIARLPVKHILHAQMHRTPIAIELERAVVEEVVRTIDVLRAIASPPDPMTDFCTRFAERYGEGSWQPLPAVLDDEVGIGFGNQGAEPTALLAGLPMQRRATSSTRAGSIEIPAVAARIWARAVESGAYEVAVSHDELRDWGVIAQAPDLELPVSFSAVFSLGRRDDGGDPEVVLRGAQGPSGVASMGRFAHAHAGVDAVVREHVAAEQRDVDAVFAEVVHLPRQRLGNVIVRPLFREYEIPCLGRSGAPADRQIHLDDLRVTVVRGEVVLWSARLDKRVIPRLASAHNSTLSPVVAYRFLCALQRHAVNMSTAWTWGGIERVASFLPRVRLGDVVVAGARWCMHKGKLTELRGAKTPQARFCAAQRLRQQARLPRYLQYGESDVQMVVDLDNPLSIDGLVHHLARSTSGVVFTEAYPRPDRHYLVGEGGCFASEYCVPIVRRPTPTPRRKTVSPRPWTPGPLAHRLEPGSEWLYLKVYGGRAACEAHLLQELAPALAELEASGAIDRWFFVRYADPQWHLRVRIHGEPGVIWGEPRARMLELATRRRASGGLWKCEVAAYEREVSRYGGPAAIELVERLFHADSVAVVDMLRACEGEGDVRWHATLLGMDRLLADLGQPAAEREQAVTEIGAAYLKQFDPTGRVGPVLSHRYRDQRATIEQLLADGGLAAVRDALQVRSEAVVDTIAQLRRRERSGALDRPLFEVSQSLLHMHANRMFRAAANEQECVLYEYLRRTYRSAIARARRSHGHGAARVAIAAERSLR